MSRLQKVTDTNLFTLKKKSVIGVFKKSVIMSSFVKKSPVNGI